MAIDGLTAYLLELRNLPTQLKAEAAGIVLDTAEAAATEVRAAYPEVTGNLRAGVRVQVVEAGQFGAAARVASTAPHAYLYENGTNGGRSRQTSQGWNRGPMPAAHVLVPIAIRRRKRMYQDLAVLLVQRGAKVTIVV